MKIKIIFNFTFMNIFKKTKINLNFFQLTLINIKITYSSDKYKKSIKSFLQKDFNFQNWNLSTVIHFLPFLVGFAQMVVSRYHNQTFPHIFEKTLPASKILNEKISFETFKFITSKKLNVNEIKKIHLYNDCFTIEFQKTNNNYLIGFFNENANIKKDIINSTNYKIILTDLIAFFENNKFSKKSTINSIFYNLDELPLQLEKINTIVSSNESFFDSYIASLPSKNIEFQIDNSSLNSQKIDFLKKGIELEKCDKPKSFATYSNSKKLTNRTICEQKNILLKQSIIKELNLFFYKVNNYPIIKLKFKNQSFNNFPYKDNSVKETLQILNKSLLIKDSALFSIREFSGYLYPDLSVKELYQLYLNNLIKLMFKNKLLLKVNFPSSFFFNFENIHENSYYLFNDLSISKRRDAFFGLNIYQNLNNKEEKSFDLDWKIATLQEIPKKENQKGVPLNDSDPDSWFLKSIGKEKTNSSNFEEPNDFSFYTNISQKPSLFSEKNLNFFIKNNKIEYHYPFFKELLLRQKFENRLHFGEIYKRNLNFSNFVNQNTSYIQKSNFQFFENWEPISINSWMIIIQFSVGLFLLRLLKDLYTDYGKELVEYVLQFASSSGIDVEEIKEQYLSEGSGYRVIKKIKKNFKDIAGIDNILPELGEIVWFLRNSGRSAKFKNSIPKGILLTGPPGTGKTLLVQAIAGEANVPVIVESGSLLSDQQQKGGGIEKLKKIFDQARLLAPCIVFLDEIDTIGEKRQNLIQTAMGGDQLIESIYETKKEINENDFIPHPLNSSEEKIAENDFEYQLFREEVDTQANNGLENFQKKGESKKSRLNLLTQFLVEMDGLKERQGIIVIGATNRPNVLDPALIRPGRFDKILKLELPGKQKRIEILKLYSKKVNIDKKISWNYLATRTQGFSAADLAAAMNESSIQAILNQTEHTIETIERGIDLVTSYNNENDIFSKNKDPKQDPLFMSRLAFYQAGKVLLQNSLVNHPPVSVFFLWPRQKNVRHAHSFEKSSLHNKTRRDLEVELIGLYAGKASESITLYSHKDFNSLKKWYSTLGIEDLLSATVLANLMVDNCFFYSNRIVSRKSNILLNNRNNKEFRENEKLEFLKSLEKEIEDEIEIEQIAKVFRTSRYQQRGFSAWWQIQVSKQTSEMDSFFADWFRIYLPDPEESILNLEWIAPDEFYHTNESLKKISHKSDTSFNDLYKIERDYLYHGLILNAFNKAVSEIEFMRDFLDYFADYLLRFTVIREDQIICILKNKKIKTSNLELLSSKSNPTLPSKSKIIRKQWGNQSRKLTLKFINFKTLKFLQKDKKISN